MAIQDLIPWRRSRESDPFTQLQSEMNRMFEDFVSGAMTPFERRAGREVGFMPRVDLTETPEAYELTAELPGMTEKDIELSLSNDILTLKGEKKVEREERKRDWYYAERSYGTFQRAFRLPGEVLADKIQAQFKDGVLTVMLPKSEQARQSTRQIPISRS